MRSTSELVAPPELDRLVGIVVRVFHGHVVHRGIAPCKVCRRRAVELATAAEWTRRR